MSYESCFSGRRGYPWFQSQVAILIFIILSSLASAQPLNSWTNPASARWEDMFWSLGILPGETQSVYVTNAGYKAVGIYDTTLSQYAESLTVSNLTVSAPDSASSTVLLNYTGLSLPLRIRNQLLIGTNGTLQNLYGRVQIDGAADGEVRLIGQGRYVQEGGQTLAPIPLRLIDGHVMNTNGNMTLGQVTMGDNSGAYFITFTHDGGSIATDYLLMNSGIYTLVHGILYALSGASITGYFYQYGGTNYGDVTVMLGGYKLYGGLLHGNVASFGLNASMEHRNGTVEMQFITVTGGAVYPDGFPSNPSYALYQGQVSCGTLNIGNNGLFEQNGGTVALTNNLDLHGFQFNTSRGIITDYADYRLAGGMFTAPSISLREFGIMNQYGGTNLLTGSGLAISSANYGMENGRLETASSGVGFQGGLIQRHGLHKINGVLSVTGNYELGGGTVDASGFYLRGILNAYSYYDTATFTVHGLTDLGGTVQAGATDIDLGQIRLSTNALIDFKNDLGRIVCFNSSGVAWTPGQSLVIANWHSGFNHISFGTDATGLTPGQLAQVRFVNPVDMPGGYYKTQILSNGELVPVPRPTLQSSRTANNLIFTWTGNYQLFSSTNVSGPYAPVPGAVSPYTNAIGTESSRFFRLQSN